MMGRMMSKRLRATFAVLALGGALGGCSSDPQGSNLAVTAGSALFDQIRSGREKPAAPRRIDVTRKLLDRTPGAVLQAIPDKTGAQDFLRLIARRNDSNPGTVEVWESSDKLQVILRNGVLVGTKGLGGDVRSAQAQTAFAGFDGHGGGGQRILTLARGNGTAQDTAFACDMTQMGREVIRIVDRNVTTHRMREHCVYGGASFTNEYWTEVGSGQMRKSRQWAGPYFGYINFLRLK